MPQHRAAKARSGTSGRARAAGPAARAGGGPKPAAGGPASAEPRTQGLLDLQQQAGNAAVVGYLEGLPQSIGPVAATLPVSRAKPLQRSEISFKSEGETLYNQTPTIDPSVPSGQAGGKHYGGGTKKFAMTRSDSAVDVKVRIKFVDQARDTNRFQADGTTPNPNYLGHLGSPAEIAAGDPRRQWGTDMTAKAPGQWNGKMKLVGKLQPAWWDIGGEPRDLSLPVNFSAEPVFDLASTDFHKQIVLYGTGVTASAAAGQPIDAGNYYMNKGNYGASAEQIYAHEYGHLIGLSDEYSQSNFQMHQLLHQISPSLGGARGATLDRETVQRMVLAALVNPLQSQLTGAAAELSGSFNASRKPVYAAVSKALRDGTSSAAVRTQMEALLTTATDPTLSGRIPDVVSFETGANFSNLTVAGDAIDWEFDPARIADRLGRQYKAAMMGIFSKKVSVGGGPSGDISINIQGGTGGGGTGIWGAGSTGGPQATAASGVASSTVGASTGPGTIPPVRPSDSLIAKIAAIPASWDTAGGLAASAFTDATMGATVAAAVKAGGVAAAASGGGAAITTSRDLYQAAYAMIQKAALNGAAAEVRKFVAAQLQPVFDASVSSLQTDVMDEVNRVMNTPAGAVAAAGPKDPNIASMVSAMQTRLANQTPPGQTSANPLAPGSPEKAAGVTVPNQEVTYSNTGTMSDNSGDIRPDQFADLVTQFNAEKNGLRRDREDPFKIQKV